MRRLVPTLAALVSLSGPALALDYTCPSDPGFCYLDAGNDGCFDPGTDTGPIDDQLEAGSFPRPPRAPAPGSIVCPPSVRVLSVNQGADWQTAAGGSILLHAAKINGRPPNGFPHPNLIAMESGDRLVLGGAIRASAMDVDLRAQNDLIVETGIRTSRRAQEVARYILLTSFAGDISIAPRAKLSSDRACVLATLGGGDVSLGAEADVRFHTFRVESDRDLKMVEPRLKGRFLELAVARDILISGSARAKTDSIQVFGGASGVISIEQISAAFRRLEMGGGSIAIGQSGGAASTLKDFEATTFFGFSGPTHTRISATGPIEIQNVELTGDPDVAIETTGTQIDLIDSFVQSPKTPAGTVTLTAAAGSTCDVTGTTFKTTTLVANCDTVVGP